ncbi:MAG TPA: SDR family oxidoreductase [Phototrophicaceae bacterium]|nr:SDR family oxidoreductase [Phototrophicaceae bacterium]
MTETTRNQVIVVTGASAGVGRATVREFAKRGARIGLVARDPERLEATRHEVEQLGGQALALPTDVADAEAVEAAAAATEAEFGALDVWINDAMTSVFSPVKAMKPEEYKRVTEVTYLGYVYGTLAALRRMLPRDHGAIIQVGSALAYRGIPLQSAYCASKHAIQGFNDSLRSELLHDHSHVTVTMVQMPALNTPQFDWEKSRLAHKAQPVPPIFQPEVAARAIVWAADHHPRELFVGGMTSGVIMGNKLFPGLGDWYLSRTGYKSQQTNEPRDPNAPYNLWEPVPGDPGAHGSFDAQAQSNSTALQLRVNRNRIAALGIGLAGIVMGAVLTAAHYVND